MRIALTGTPGVGKTSVAQELSKRLNLDHIEITKIASEWGAVLEKDEESLVVDEDILRENLENLDNIIIDSHFAEIFDVDLVFVLRCEPKILYERLKERGYSEKKVKENVMAEILDYCLVNALEYHEPEKVFEICENAVDEISKIVENPQKEKSLAYGSRTHFLTEENLRLADDYPRI